jgi:hypothetical protein
MTSLTKDSLYQLREYPYDLQGLQFNWSKNFIVDKQSFDSGLPLSTAEDVDFTCYTDGSHVEGHTGAGFTLFYAGEEVLNNSLYLGTIASVFQEELYAITQACLDIAEFLDDHCHLPFILTLRLPF